MYRGKRSLTVEVYWKTVTYRTVAIYLLLIFAIVMATLYLIYPESYSSAIASVSQRAGSRARTRAPN